MYKFKILKAGRHLKQAMEMLIQNFTKAVTAF